MSGRHMKFPYTLAAKVVQFPYKFHWDNFWLPRFVAMSMVVTFPFFLFIQRKVNTPENKAIWAEKHKEERQFCICYDAVYCQTNSFNYIEQFWRNRCFCKCKDNFGHQSFPLKDIT